MTFRRKVVGIGDGYVEYEKPCGCMLYIRKICLETVGGFDTEFSGYGFEHVNWSDRIYNAGLTPNRYIDIPESSNVLYSLDLNHEVESSFSAESRRMIPHNYKLQQEKYLSKEEGKKVTFQFKQMDFDNIVTQLQGDQVDLGISGFTYSEDLKVEWSEPYLGSSKVAFVPKGSDITSFDLL